MAQRLKLNARNVNSVCPRVIKLQCFLNFLLYFSTLQCFYKSVISFTIRKKLSVKKITYTNMTRKDGCLNFPDYRCLSIRSDLICNTSSLEITCSFHQWVIVFPFQVISKDIKNIRCKMSHESNSQATTHIERSLPFIVTLYLQLFISSHPQ